MSSYFLDAVWSLKDHPLIADLRGIGMMAGVEVKHDGVPGRRGTQLQKDMFWNGLHVKFTGDNGILAPAFVWLSAAISMRLLINSARRWTSTARQAMLA